MKQYDAIIIGAGQSGVPLAKKLADKGLKTALIERKWIGGTCINTGCTPTKTMISSGRIAHLVANASKWGIHSSMKVDMPAILKRKNKIVKSFRDGSREGLEKQDGLDLIFGEARFIDQKKLEIRLDEGQTQEITAQKIFIDTGAQTVIPKIPGIDAINYLTSDSILDLLVIPEHLLIVGASYIALEFGQLFRRLGSKVTMLEHNSKFLSREDEDVATELQKILEEDGITIELNAEVTSFQSSSTGVKGLPYL